MYPILYKKDETDFSHNGIGVMVDTVSAVVTEELNGSCELKLQYDASGRLFENIDNEMIIKAKSNDTQDPQLFRIYEHDKDQENDCVTIYAQHITYDLANNFIDKLNMENVSAVFAMSQIQSNLAYPTKFTFFSDSDTVSSTILDKVNPLQAVAGIDGSILDNWGGEIERDNFKISLYKRRGRDNAARISWRKNLTGLTAKFDIQGVITRIYPYAKLEDETEITLPEKYIDSPEINNYVCPHIQPVDFSQDDSVIDAATLRTAASKYFNSGDHDKAKASMDVQFEPLWQTEEYKDVANLERVGLADTVLIDNERLNITATAKVIKIEYNVLTEKNDSVQLGDTKADFTSSTNNNISAAVKNGTRDLASKSLLQNAVDHATSMITGNNGGNIVIYPKEHPQEIFIMDTDDVNTAKHVWRWNLGGLGYSSTGVNGPFATAITADGQIVADFITTGELLANLIKTGVITSKDGNFSISLDSGHFKTFVDGKVAIDMYNQTIEWHDWQGNADLTGQIQSARIMDAQGNPTGKQVFTLNIPHGIYLDLASDEGDNPNIPILRISNYADDASKRQLNIMEDISIYKRDDPTHGIAVTAGKFHSYADVDLHGWTLKNVGNITMSSGKTSWTGVITVDGIKMTFEKGILVNSEEV